MTESTPEDRRNAFAIRRATAADVESLFDIRSSVVENRMTRDELLAIGITPEVVAASLTRGLTVAFVAIKDDRALGFSMARADVRDIFALFVRPSAQGSGVGSSLLVEAERWLATKKVRSAWLSTGDGTCAVAFYEKRGWRKKGRQADGQILFTKRLDKAS